MSKENTVIYRPEVFSVNNLHEAQQIILTPEKGTSTEERWEKETPFLSDAIGNFINPSDKTFIMHLKKDGNSLSLMSMVDRA